MRLLISLSLLSLLSACASYSGSNLKPGQANLDDVLHVMGQPAMRWQDADGSQQLAYPRGPQGTDTFMVHVGADDVLQNIENVLTWETLTRIRPGMTKEQVLRMLGPPEPSWTIYFERRDELAWEWRYCDQWTEAARIDVLLDASRGVVRSTYSRVESCGRSACTCGH